MLQCFDRYNNHIPKKILSLMELCSCHVNNNQLVLKLYSSSFFREGGTEIAIDTVRYCSILLGIAQYCLILLRTAWYRSVLLSTVRISCISVTSQKWKEFVTEKIKITHPIEKSKNWVYRFLSFTINLYRTKVTFAVTQVKVKCLKNSGWQWT
jgi:hypothetical protein